MDKGIIFYSNGILEPIKSMVEESIEVGLPIVKSYSKGSSYKEMVQQIIFCLERSWTKYVFFCEHDVIYNKSHFDFTPEKDNIFYYNENVWRWDYPKERYITYDRLISLSGMCVNREFALEHFKKRLYKIPDNDILCRTMGYEPGTKKKRRGGFSNDDFETWKSDKPLIDIRHNKTFSPRKVELKSFKHKPTGWKETYERP